MNVNIGLLLIMIIGGVAGLLSTLYLVFSLPAVLIWKVYRKITKGISLMK
ncbi:MAG: hypothetical protein ACI4SD_02805 [Suilimivivens sp.]